MRINFTNIQVNQEKEISKAQTAEKKEIRAAAVFAENPFSATQTKQGIYDKQEKRWRISRQKLLMWILPL